MVSPQLIRVHATRSGQRSKVKVTGHWVPEVCDSLSVVYMIT